MKKVIVLFILVCCMLCITSCAAQSSSHSDTADSSDASVRSSNLDASSSTAAQTDKASDTTSETENTDTERSKEMNIRVTDASNEVVFKLNDSSASKSLYSQLPLTVEVRNYSSNEKIFNIPKELDTSDVIEGNGPAGTLGYFSPWGNVVMYYGKFDAYPGLYILGEATQNADSIKQLSGTITITAE